MSGKEIVIDWIRDLPDSSSVTDVVEALRIRSEIREARDDMEAGRLISQDELERESATWSSP